MELQSIPIVKTSWTMRNKIEAPHFLNSKQQTKLLESKHHGSGAKNRQIDRWERQSFLNKLIDGTKWSWKRIPGGHNVERIVSSRSKRMKRQLDNVKHFCKAYIWIGANSQSIYKRLTLNCKKQKLKANNSIKKMAKILKRPVSKESLHGPQSYERPQYY